MRPEIRPFDASFLDEAAALLAGRHREHRQAWPALDPAFEQPARAREEIERLTAAPGVSGVVATRGGRLAGYLLGIGKDPSIWGPNTWVESAGQAVVEPEIVRDLYRAAAAAWVEAGRTRHYVLVPATAGGLIDAWNRLGFGQQHVHALRDAAPPAFRPGPVPGLAVRRAERADIPELATLELVLPEHQARSPVFASLPMPSLEEAQAELEEEFDDPRFATFVAVRDGRVVGTATGCSLEVSSINTGLIRPPAAGFLGYAAVLPEARGLGAGRALGETVIAWSTAAGYPCVATDWRATNIEASRAWPALGFRPTFLRLYRVIG